MTVPADVPGALAWALAFQRVALVETLRARRISEAEITCRVDELRYVQAGQAAICGYPDLAAELRRETVPWPAVTEDAVPGEGHPESGHRLVAATWQLAGDLTQPPA